MMRGNNPTIKDIELNLHDLVLPANLLTDESLSPDDFPEEEQQLPFKIDCSCGTCGAGVRLVVLATQIGISTLQQLLTSDLSVICPRCFRGHFHHGRS
uniref:Protein E7 n=1 Tax=Human papillomavirus TaxID=10566 RepID=A0A385PJU1_9PAPI|nr:MAG: E7 protein [Human papillomavirus]